MSRPRRLFRPVLLAAALCAANLAVAALPASAPFSPAQQQAIRQISASEAQAQVPWVVSAAAASVAKTIEGEKQAIDVAKDALEVGRKSVDWWLSNISVWLGGLGLLIGVAGIGIPLWMGRKQKAEWQEKLADITQKLAQAQAAQQQAAAAQQQAEQHAREIETLLHTARDKTSLIPSAEDIKGELSAEVLDKLRTEKSPLVVKLIRQAWEAHGKADWSAAKPLWALLSMIESQDANVWFNLALAEQLSSKNWSKVCEAYQRAHHLERSVNVCVNWGNALSAWANALDAHEQQACFIEADHLFREATCLKPDDVDAFNNWISMLLSWSHTLHDEERTAKLDEAEGVLLLAKDKGLKNLYNLACLRAIQQRPDEARALLEETRAAGLLPDFSHLSTDRDLVNLRELDWFQALLEEVKQQEAASQAAA